MAAGKPIRDLRENETPDVHSDHQALSVVEGRLNGTLFSCTSLSAICSPDPYLDELLKTSGGGETFRMS